MSHPTAHESNAGLMQREALAGALVRALTGDARLQWSAQTLYQGAQVIPLQAAHQVEVPLQVVDQRALIDGAALRLLYSDQALHAQHAPVDAIERLMFELLEQLRVESLVSADWPGVRANLAQRFTHWAQSFIDSGLTETVLGILLFSLSVTVWSRLTGNEIPELMADLAEGTRISVAPEIGSWLVQLRQQRSTQGAFIPPALAFSRWLSQRVRAAQADPNVAASSARRRNNFALYIHFTTVSPPPPPLAASGSSRSWQATAQRYRVFTRAYDRELIATNMVRATQLAEFRAQLDQEARGLNLTRLARFFHHALAVPIRDDWQFAQEEGRLDGRRLAQLVSAPHERAVFKNEMQRPLMASAITFLLDCSGSMKTYAQSTSLLIDSLGRALTRAGVRVEILGFSTHAWTGGRARRDWQRAGCPQFPGRLNELAHYIFKAADQSWRQGRLGLAALRRLDLYREGVDGEALEWACQRLLQIPAQRRLLVVLSDGCPMDSATNHSNDEYYLDQHLKQVIAQYERSREVELCGVGLGLDLGPFYRRRLALDLTAGIDDACLWQVAQFIAAVARQR